MLFQLSNGTSYSQTGGEPVFYFAIINLKEVRAFKHPNVLWYWVKTFSKRSVKLSLRRWRFLCALDENEGDGDAKTSGGAGSGVVSQFSLPHSSRGFAARFRGSAAENSHKTAIFAGYLELEFFFALQPQQKPSYRINSKSMVQLTFTLSL